MILDLALPGSAKSRMARGTGRSRHLDTPEPAILGCSPLKIASCESRGRVGCLDEDDDSAARTPGRDLSYCIELRFRMF